MSGAGKGVQITSAHCDCLLFCALEIILLTYLLFHPWSCLALLSRVSKNLNHNVCK